MAAVWPFAGSVRGASSVRTVGRAVVLPCIPPTQRPLPCHPGPWPAPACLPLTPSLHCCLRAGYITMRRPTPAAAEQPVATAHKRGALDWAFVAAMVLAIGGVCVGAPHSGAVAGCEGWWAGRPAAGVACWPGPQADPHCRRAPHARAGLGGIASLTANCNTGSDPFLGVSLPSAAACGSALLPARCQCMPDGDTTGLPRGWWCRMDPGPAAVRRPCFGSCGFCRCAALCHRAVVFARWTGPGPELGSSSSRADEGLATTAAPLPAAPGCLPGPCDCLARLEEHPQLPGQCACTRRWCGEQRLNLSVRPPTAPALWPWHACSRRCGRWRLLSPV